MVVLLVLAVAGVAVLALYSRPSRQPPATEAPGVIGTLAPAAEPSMVIGTFARLLSEYTSFTDAEAAAGYHIPQSSLYPHPYPQSVVALRRLPRGKPDWRRAAESHYTYPPLAPEGITVNVGPSYLYRGDTTFTQGAPTTIAGISGYMFPSDNVFEFDYRCGTVDSVSLWCQVWGPKGMGRAKFDEFVVSLH
jgi:hypothetical protein